MAPPEYVGQALAYREDLTGLTREITNEDFIGGEMFPEVPDTSPLFSVPAFEKDLKALVSTKRAIYGPTNKMKPDKAGNIEAELEPHDAAWPLDKVEKFAHQHARSRRVPIRSLEKRANRKTRDNVLLVQEKEQAQLAQADSSYAAGHAVEFTGTSLWTDPASTPIQDVNQGKQIVSGKIMKMPNCLEIPDNVYWILKEHPQLKSYLSADADKLVTLEVMKKLFEIEHIYIGKAVEQDPLTDSLVKLWMDYVILYYRNFNLKPKNEYEVDMSFGFTFRAKGFPYADEYTTDDGNQKYIRNNDYRLTMVLSSEAAYKMKVKA